MIETGETGDLDVPPGRGFSGTGEVFFSPRVSAQVTALFVNPEAILHPSAPPPDDVDLGTLGLDLYTVSVRRHFAPQRRISAFVGAGGALAMLGDLDDRFADEVQADFDDEVTFLVEGGVRYRYRPRIFVEFSVAYVPLEAETQIERSPYALPAKLGLDPVILSLGASWRF